MRVPLIRMRAALSLALVVSAALFALGGSLERSQAARHHDTHAAATAPGDAHAGEAVPPASTAPAEADGGHEGAAAPAVATEPAAESETLLGVDPESTALTAVGVVLSLLLAAGVWLPWARGRAGLLLLVAVAAFGLVFAAGDGRELAHQLRESRSGLAALAAAVLVLHLMVAGAAAAGLRAQRATG